MKMELSKFYDLRPIPTTEAFQNFGMDDIEDMNLDQLKDEYKRALKEKKELEKEYDDIHGKSPADFALRERIDNSQKYIDKVRKKLDSQISNEELKRIEKSADEDPKKEEDI